MRSLLALALIASPVLMAGPSSTAKADVTVRIVAPCHIESSGVLDFGTVLMNDYTSGGAVSITPKTAAGGTSQATIPVYAGCTAFKSSSDMTVAEFHYRHDVNFPVNITIQGHKIDPTAVSGIVTHGTVDLNGGAKLAVTTDAPADSCGLFPAIPGVEDKHFGVGGLLTIPGNTFGTQKGTINVSIAYN